MAVGPFSAKPLPLAKRLEEVREGDTEGTGQTCKGGDAEVSLPATT